MRAPTLALVLCLAACTSQAAETDLVHLSRDVEQNGLAGWDGDPRFWSAADGVISGQSTADVPCEKTTYLVWRGGEVDDFELSFQVRITGGNSGVQFRSKEVATWDVHGYQADLDAANQWTGCLYEQGGRGVVATRGQHVTFDTEGARADATLPGAQDGFELALPATPEWIDYKIRAHGDVLTLEVGGVQTVEIVDESPVKSATGILALQMHQGEAMHVEYRNMVLRPIK